MKQTPLKNFKNVWNDALQFPERKSNADEREYKVTAIKSKSQIAKCQNCHKAKLPNSQKAKLPNSHIAK